jgi:hypothetical protein
MVPEQFKRNRPLSMDPRQTVQYFEVLEKERRRAWGRYGLILLTGLEFNRPGIGPARAQRLWRLGCLHRSTRGCHGIG